MINCKKTDSGDKDFIALASLLDKELSDRYLEMQTQYEIHNQVSEDLPVVIAYENEIPVGCCCYKVYAPQTIEIKRMYVKPGYRNRGYAIILLRMLEQWAAEQGFKKAKLETGTRQPESIALYRKSGYILTDNYGPYVGKSESVCMEKALI